MNNSAKAFVDELKKKHFSEAKQFLEKCVASKAENRIARILSSKRRK